MPLQRIIIDQGEVMGMPAVNFIYPPVNLFRSYRDLWLQSVESVEIMG